MKEIYRLEVNGRTICQARIEVPHWWPIQTHLGLKWIRQLIRTALIQRPIAV
jgi:hypothetical protein